MSDLLTQTEMTVSQLRRACVEGSGFYLVLDACEGIAIPSKVESLGEERAMSLYGSNAKEDYWAISPYLVRCDLGLLDWLYTSLPQKSRGILIRSSNDLTDVRRTLRRLLVVDGPTGGEMLFRFYDGRVLRKFLSVCNRAEIGALFAGIYFWGIPTETGFQLFRPHFSLQNLEHPVRLCLREEHLAVFAPEAETAFITRLGAHLREQHAALVSSIPDDLLALMVQTGIARARRNGLRWESSIAAFVAIMFEIAPNFDAHPVIRSYLTDLRIDPESRMRSVVAHVPEEIWVEAAAQYDSGGWLPADLGEDYEISEDADAIHEEYRRRTGFIR